MIVHILVSLLGERHLDWNVSLTGTLHLLQMYILFTGSDRTDVYAVRSRCLSVPGV